MLFRTPFPSYVGRAAASQSEAFALSIVGDICAGGRDEGNWNCRAAFYKCNDRPNNDMSNAVNNRLFLLVLRQSRRQGNSDAF